MQLMVTSSKQELDPEQLEACRRGVELLTNGRYEVIRVLGQGGMSVVLLGLDLAKARRVAIKLLDPKEASSIDNRERFRREAIISAQLDHPHIVPCYQFLRRGKLALAVMRYIPGPSLEERLGSDSRLTVASTLALLTPLAAALAHAHRRGVVHRDIKPANILLQDPNETDWPFLTDFGIATLGTSDHSRSEVGKGFGTPAYMSPEQVLGRWDADARTDIYSLGLVGYRALCGRLPFQAESAISLAAQRTVREAQPIRTLAPEVPQRLAAILDRCLARDPRDRWRSCDALHQALIRCSSSLSRHRRGFSSLTGLFDRLRSIA